MPADAVPINITFTGFGTDNINISALNDNVSFEDGDSFVLNYKHVFPTLIPLVESAGEFVRDTVIVHIIDTDGKSLFYFHR